jgi:hypothetical protein
MAGYLDFDEDDNYGGGTRVLERPAGTIDVDIETSNFDTEDAERFAHWVDANKADRAALRDGAVVALCGKVWKPSKNPDDYPICPQCEELHDKLIKEGIGQDL